MFSILVKKLRNAAIQIRNFNLNDTWGELLSIGSEKSLTWQEEVGHLKSRNGSVQLGSGRRRLLLPSKLVSFPHP